jgi:hypothetical protein
VRRPALTVASPALQIAGPGGACAPATIAGPGSACAPATIAGTRTEELQVRHVTVALVRRSAAALMALAAVALLLLGAAAPASAAGTSGPSVRVIGTAAPSAAGSLAAAKAGQVVDIALSGFGPRTAVLVSIGPAALPRLVTTDTRGAATAVAIVPKLPTDDYLVTAASRGASASVPLRVVTKGGGAPLQWIAPVTSSRSSGARTSSVVARAATAAKLAAAPQSAATTAPSAVPPSIAAADSSQAALPVTSLAALPASATSTPVGGWVGLAALLALAVGGSLAAVAWGLRRDAEVEPLGRHAPGHAASGTAPLDQAREAAALVLDKARETAALALREGRETAGRLAVVARRHAATVGPQARAAWTELSARATELREARTAFDDDAPVGRHGHSA